MNSAFKPAASVLSSLPIAHLIGEKSDEEIGKEWIERGNESSSLVESPPLTLTARSNGSLHEQCQAMNKMEVRREKRIWNIQRDQLIQFMLPRIDREVDQIWKIIEKKVKKNEERCRDNVVFAGFLHEGRWSIIRKYGFGDRGNG